MLIQKMLFHSLILSHIIKWGISITGHLWFDTFMRRTISRVWLTSDPALYIYMYSCIIAATRKFACNKKSIVAQLSNINAVVSQHWCSIVLHIVASFSMDDHVVCRSFAVRTAILLPRSKVGFGRDMRDALDSSIRS